MYINKGNNDFRDIVAHEYVDKTSLIPLVNAMLNSENRYSCDTTEFRNDMRIIRSKNDVLTVLIHLGYLAYDGDAQECYLPNKEVADGFLNAVEDTSWVRLVEALTASRNLLTATISGN